MGEQAIQLIYMDLIKIIWQSVLEMYSCFITGFLKKGHSNKLGSGLKFYLKANDDRFGLLTLFRYQQIPVKTSYAMKDNYPALGFYNSSAFVIFSVLGVFRCLIKRSLNHV